MEINVLIEEGLEIDLEIEWLQSILEKTLLAEDASPNTEISLVLTGQERIHELNRDYRGKDNLPMFFHFLWLSRAPKKNRPNLLNHQMD